MGESQIRVVADCLRRVGYRVGIQLIPEAVIGPAWQQAAKLGALGTNKEFFSVHDRVARACCYQIFIDSNLNPRVV
jgi:hypothetical protein